MRCPLVASQAVCLESIPRVATCAMTPRRAPPSSTMATRIAATRVPLAARRSGELRPCKLAPASGAKRSTRSPAHCPCASCRQMRTGRRRQSLLSDARHRSPICTPQLVAPIDARVGGLQPRDERSRHLDLSRPHFPLGQPGLRFLAKGLRPRIRGAGLYMWNTGQPLFGRSSLYGGLHFTLALLLLSA